MKDSELLAHETGWHWLITFAAPGSTVSGYSVIHADGYVLQLSQALEIVTSISSLSHLGYVGPDAQEVEAVVDEARSRYIEYLIKEYGYITLEGLPADQEVGSRSLRLESIFVPLSLEKVASEITDEDVDEDSGKPTTDSEPDEYDSDRAANPPGQNTPRNRSGKSLLSITASPSLAAQALARPRF